MQPHPLLFPLLNIAHLKQDLLHVRSKGFNRKTLTKKVSRLSLFRPPDTIIWILMVCSDPSINEANWLTFWVGLTTSRPSASDHNNEPFTLHSCIGTGISSQSAMCKPWHCSLSCTSLDTEFRCLSGMGTSSLVSRVRDNSYITTL